MKAAPATPFKVPKAKFLLQFLIIALDDPAVSGEVDQIVDCCVGRKRGQPVLRGFFFFPGPSDQEPFFGMRLGPPVIAMSWPDAHG